MKPLFTEEGPLSAKVITEIVVITGPRIMPAHVVVPGGLDADLSPPDLIEIGLWELRVDFPSRTFGSSAH